MKFQERVSESILECWSGKHYFYESKTVVDKQFRSSDETKRFKGRFWDSQSSQSESWQSNLGRGVASEVTQSFARTTTQH